MDLERWLPVSDPRFSARYEVSSLGRVRRLRKAVEKSLIRKPYRSVKGYSCVRIYGKDGIWRDFRLHRLVLAAFVGPIPEGHEVDHINCDKLDNALRNLEYVTHDENMRRAARHGLMIGKKGFDAHRAKVKPDEAAEIVRLRESGMAIGEIAQKVGYGKTTVQRFCANLPRFISRRRRAA